MERKIALTVANPPSYTVPPLSVPANPSAPQSINPVPPIRFQNPMCQPKDPKAGLYHADWVSSIIRMEETMKPVPPRTDYKP